MPHFFYFSSPFGPSDGRIGERPLTRPPIFIVLVRPEAPNLPKHWTPLTPQLERTLSGYISHVSTTFSYSIHQVSSQSLHYKRFPRFPVFPSSSQQCPQIWSGFKIKALRHELLLNIKFH